MGVSATERCQPRYLHWAALGAGPPHCYTFRAPVWCSGGGYGSLSLANNLSWVVTWPPLKVLFCKGLVSLLLQHCNESSPHWCGCKGCFRQSQTLSQGKQHQKWCNINFKINILDQEFRKYQKYRDLVSSWQNLRVYRCSLRCWCLLKGGLVRRSGLFIVIMQEFHWKKFVNLRWIQKETIL